MTWIEMLVACWQTHRLVKQGNHRTRITQLLTVLRVQVELEFTEDNLATQNAFLHDCLNDAMPEFSK